MSRSDPPGFASKSFSIPEIVHYKDGAAAAAARTSQNIPALEARAMQIASSQMSAVGQTCFFLYMFVGNQLSLISVYMMLSMGTGPLRNILNVQQTFAALEAPGARLTMAKLVFIALNLVGVGFFLWKLRSTGLLPITSADWFTLLPHRMQIEHGALANDVSV